MCRTPRRLTASPALLVAIFASNMPEAFERGKPFTAFACAAGFSRSFILAA